MRRLPLRSPPRMRGKVWLHQKPGRVPGITPAYAGKSQRTAFPVAGGQDHPRVCGEKCPNCGRKMKQQGSPPRMRGKGAFELLDCQLDGITPAYAGKSFCPAYSFCRRWDHPRVCGEKLFDLTAKVTDKGSPPRMRGKEPDTIITELTDGITPAYAGKRVPRVYGPSVPGDHPRVCGEKGIPK